MPKTELMRIVLYDSRRNEWRTFDVVPPDPNFRSECRGTLHQFGLLGLLKTCVCGEVMKP